MALHQKAVGVVCKNFRVHEGESEWRLANSKMNLEGWKVGRLEDWRVGGLECPDFGRRSVCVIYVYFIPENVPSKAFGVQGCEWLLSFFAGFLLFRLGQAWSATGFATIPVRMIDFASGLCLWLACSAQRYELRPI
jgi:hypothetical protein